MPRFRHGASTSPLLPAQVSSSLRLSKRKPQTSWADVAAQVGPVLIISIIFLGGMMCLLLVVGGRRTGSNSTSSSFSLKEQPPATTGSPRRNAVLQQRLDALIEEATKVAREKGIITETDAAEEERLRAFQEDEDWTWLLENRISSGDDDESDIELNARMKLCSSRGEECGPHGICGDDAQCKCALAFAGKYCGHSILLSRSFTSSSLIGYEGDLVLHQGSEDVSEIVKEEEKVQHLLLPAADTFFKGKVYESCGVVGSSENLLLEKYGAAIETHSLVFRIGTEVAVKKRFEGAQRVVTVVEHILEVRDEDEEEQSLVVLLVNSSTATESLIKSLKMYFENSSSSSSTLLVIHPGFVSHVEAVVSAAATTDAGRHGKPTTTTTAAAAALVLAMNVCHSVAIYGVVTPPLQGLPVTYYNAGPEKEQEERHAPAT